MNEKLIKLKANAEKFGLELNDSILDKFEKFEEFLREYNSHTNLVSAKDINLIYEKHFTDSISFGKYINIMQDAKILDIGSGGGFPIIPISIILNKNEIKAIDSTNKKIIFLNQAAEKLNLKNFTAINTRAEKLAFEKKHREKYNIVTARAVGNLAQISELCIPFLNLGGHFIAYKSAKVNDEIQEAKNTIKIMGGEIIDIFEYNLESEENFKRNLVLIKKTKETPTDYPRKFSTIKYKRL